MNGLKVIYNVELIKRSMNTTKSIEVKDLSKQWNTIGQLKVICRIKLYASSWGVEEEELLLLVLVLVKYDVEWMSFKCTTSYSRTMRAKVSTCHHLLYNVSFGTTWNDWRRFMEKISNFKLEFGWDNIVLIYCQVKQLWSKLKII